ncbi:MAG TPA: DEAD/DEAH box helicase [Candidatus Nitrosopelagicus sp.]|jgi:ATP-dependent RNA helicase DeaD|nr:DEAD/DEAH box helicase [Candidatus Nitrosopelagicus sp.]
MKTFDELKVKKTILEGIQELGFNVPFPIQAQAIPILLEGNDVIGQAHTGTGKTAAFGIPMLEHILNNGGIQGLIIAPTRELAMQITTELRKVGKFTGIKIATIYGGQGMGIQLDALRNKPEVVVATPGRLIDHINRGTVKVNNIKFLALDEADVMLDMGFIDDIEFVLERVPENKITSLWSATMPAEILRLSEKYLNKPKRVLIDADDLSGEGINQSFLVIKDREKQKYLTTFIKENKKGQTIVFCSTKIRTRNVARDLQKARFNVVAIEGDMSQNKREYSMSKFRKNSADILVATDVAARGIDVPRVGLVVNYDVPNQDMVYFHRIGRTARAGAKGNAITLVSYSSVGDWNIIKRQVKSDMTDLNQKLGIEINIPDPLKRQVGQRMAPQIRSGYGGKFRRSYGSGGRRFGGNNRNGGARDGPARDQYKKKRFTQSSSSSRDGNRDGRRNPSRKRW